MTQEVGTPMPARLVDRFGREHRDLRVSLTDRCNLRCTYCMPAEGLEWLPSADQLTVEEITRVVRVATQLGITEVRLTGGEPLIRPDVVDIVARITALPLAPDMSVTTNGLRLAALAGPLADAGLARVNISCDTLSPETFAKLTLRDRLDDVLAGIAAARAAGLAPIKVNTVLMRGVNDHEAAPLLRWALSEGLSPAVHRADAAGPPARLEPGHDGDPVRDPGSAAAGRLPAQRRSRSWLGTGRGVPGGRRPRPGGHRRLGDQSVL